MGEHENKIKILVVLICSIYCDGVSIEEQLQHIARRRAEILGLSRNNQISRRFSTFGNDGVILGSPSYIHHLPAAEDILPGHTLLRPALGMLKSAIKFPHKELEDGSGVYGNWDNYGLTYDGTGERVLYTRFRRMASPRDYVLVELPGNQVLQFKKKVVRRPRLTTADVVRDLEKQYRNDMKIRNLLDKIVDIARHKKDVYDFRSDKGHSDVKNRNLRPVRNRLRTFHSIEARKMATPTPGPKVDSSDGSTSSEEPDQAYGLLEEKIIKRKRDEEENKKKNRLKHQTDKDKDSNESQSETENIRTTTEHGEEDDVTEMSAKLKWWLDSKSMFDHVKINPEAPDLKEFVLTDPEGGVQKDSNEKKWWFFVQDDFQPFTHASAEAKPATQNSAET